MNAATDEIVAGFENLTAQNTIDLSTLNLDKYSIVAVVNPDHPDAASVGSVKFESDLGNQLENIVPYALFGDSQGDFDGATLQTGDFSVKATAFSGQDGSGAAIATKTVDYTVIKSSDTSDPIDPEPTEPTPTPEPTPEPEPAPDNTSGGDTNGTGGELIRLALVNAATDELVPGFDDLAVQGTIDLNNLNFEQYSIVAIVNPDHPDAASVGSVQFESSLSNQVENIAPYALFSDSQGDFDGATFQTGDFSIKVTVFSGQDGSGEEIATTTVDYTVIDTAVAVDPTPTPEPDPTLDPTPDPNPDVDMSLLVNQFDHIVSHFDGNNRDPDDIAALPIAAALTNAQGIQGKSTFFYNNNMGQPNDPDFVAAMRESAAFAEKLGIPTYDYQADADAATDALVEIFNSGQKILVLEGGRMETTYRAFEKTDPDKLQNITLISHSVHNENYDLGGTRTWSDLQQDFPEATYVHIPDQNKGFNDSGWTWLDSTSDPILQEARALMENAGGVKINDPSDAGMHFYAITGDITGQPEEAQAFFEDHPPTLDGTGGTSTGSSSSPEPLVSPTPESSNTVFLADNGQLVMEAESAPLMGNWQPITAAGEETILWDATQSSYNRVLADETLTYQFETDEAGIYSIALRSGRIKDAMNASDRYESGDSGAERTDTGNDAYVAVINAQTGEVVQAPTKLYTGLGRSDGELRWGTTFDANGQKSPARVTLEANTQYRLEITGRSDGYFLDRITLSNDGSLQDASAPVSAVKV